MSIRITKEKAINDVQKFKEQIIKKGINSFSREDVCKILDDVSDEISKIDRVDITKIENNPTIKKEDSRLKFIIPLEQSHQIYKWWTHHKNEKHPNYNNDDFNDGTLSYKFLPRKKGGRLIVKCFCGEQIDITEK